MPWIIKGAFVMSGSNLLIDTNIALYLFQGDRTVATFLDKKQIYVSFVTELELLGYSHSKPSDRESVRAFLDYCVIIDINGFIKEKTVELRAAYKIKLPDAIIMATALQLGIPLVTADQGFKKVTEMNLVWYDRSKSGQ